MAEVLKTVETPEAPPVIGAGFSEAMAGVELDWGDDGEFHYRETGVPASETKEAAPVETPSEKTPGIETEPEEKKEEAPGISPEIQAILDQNKMLLEKLSDRDKPPEDTGADSKPAAYNILDDVPEGQDIIDVLNGPREDAAKWLSDVMDKKNAENMKPVRDEVQKIVVERAIYNQVKELAQSKDGEDFKKRVPLIAELSLKRPELSVRELYDSVKSLPLPNPAPAKATQVEARREEPKPPAVSPQETVQAITARSAKLMTEKGVSGGNKGPEQYTTLTDALNAAVDEVSSL